MPARIQKHGSSYSVSTPHGVKAKHTTLAKAKAQKRLLNAVDHGWKPTHNKESVAADARQVVALLLDADPDAKETGRLERGYVEPSSIVNGKTIGKLRFPRNWKVGHAIKS